MEFIEESDISSESEGEINFKIPNRKDVIIPEEFSVDNLLKERVNNPIIPRSYSYQENSIIIEPLPSHRKKVSSHIPPIEHLYLKDGCIFKPIKNQFPFIVYEILDIDEKEQESLFISFQNRIPNYLIKCIQNYPDQVPPSLELFFSYAHYIVLNNIIDSSMSLLKYSQLLQPHTVDYKMWLNFLIYSIRHSFNAVFSLFNVCNFFLFKFETQEQADNARIEIFLLYFAIICSTDFIENKNFSLILHQIRSCLIDTDFDLSQINFVVKNMHDMFKNIPIEMISSIVSYYPIDGIGAILLHNFAIKIIFHYFGLEITEDDQNLNIENLANELYKVQILCNFDDDDDLKKASAVIALTERALISALQFSVVPNEAILKMMHILRFSIKGTDLGMLTSLKEQIHFTRAQFETLSQTVIRPPKESNLFFESDLN